MKVVVPPSSISRQPRRVPQRTKSAETFLASAGKMNFSSQSCSFRSSAMPRKSDMAACVWVLISPGARIASGGRAAASPGICASISACVPTADDAIARDRHRAVLDDATLRILGDDIARAPDPVGRFGGRSSEDEKEKSYKIRNIEGLREQSFRR